MSEITATGGAAPESYPLFVLDWDLDYNPRISAANTQRTEWALSSVMTDLPAVFGDEIAVSNIVVHGAEGEEMQPLLWLGLQALSEGTNYCQVWAVSEDMATAIRYRMVEDQADATKPRDTWGTGTQDMMITNAGGVSLLVVCSEAQVDDTLSNSGLWVGVIDTTPRDNTGPGGVDEGGGGGEGGGEGG